MTSIANMMGDPPPSAEIGRLFGAWGGERKHSNRHNFGFMTATNSVFDSISGFRGLAIWWRHCHSWNCSIWVTVKLGTGPHSSHSFAVLFIPCLLFRCSWILDFQLVQKMDFSTYRPTTLLYSATGRMWIRSAAWQRTTLCTICVKEQCSL